MDLDTAQLRVLDAAERLFNKRGVQSVGMDDIRTASGVSLKRLYQVFPAKDRLVEAVLRRRDHAITTAMTDHVGPDASPRQRILGVFDYLRHWFAEPDFRGCAFINCFGELGGTSDRIAGMARAAKQGLRDYLGELVADAGLPPALADQLAILANGAMVTAAIFGTPEPALQAKAAATVLLNAAQRR